MGPKGLKMGVAAIGGVTNYLVQGVQARMNESAQEFSNTMRKISSAQQLNAAARSTAQIQDKAVRLGQSMSEKSMQDIGSAEVNAAAAGVEGGSVDRALLGLRRSALGAQDARLRNRDSALLGVEQQKKGIRLAGIFGEDISVIPRPNPASALLGLGMQMIEIQDENNPDGYQIADNPTLANWF